MRALDTLILHCAATEPGWMAGQALAEQVAEIDRWHRARGWAGIGYHLLIGRDGTVAPGRPVSRRGAHTRGRNTGSVAVCLIGGKWPGGRDARADDSFADHFTPEQDRAAIALIARLRAEHGPLALHGHNDFAAKGCPGFRVAPWAAERGIPTHPEGEDA